MSKNTKKNPNEEVIPNGISDKVEVNQQADNQPQKRKKKMEKVLDYNPRTGLLIPIKWRFPYSFKRKDYIAVVIGLNTRYEFERFFLEKTEFEIDEGEKREIGVGFGKADFREDLILEERYSLKENESFVTRINYYKIFLLDDGVYGESMSKSEIREYLEVKQQMIYQKFKEIIKEFGDEFTIYTMRSILKQRENLVAKKININFFD